MPETLVWQAEAESSFNPSAQSPVGARGLYQFIPASPKEYGLSLDPTDGPLDPAMFAADAAKYLSVIHRCFCDFAVAFVLQLRHNQHSRHPRQDRRKNLRRRPILPPAETRLYISKIDFLL